MDDPIPEKKRPKAGKLPEAALLLAGLTGLWFFMGFAHEEGSFTRMGLPTGDILREPPYYIFRGFMDSLFLVVALAYLGLFFAVASVVRARKRPLRDALRPLGSWSHALLPLLTASAIVLAILRYFVASSTGFPLGPVTVPIRLFEWAIVGVLLTFLVAIFFLLLTRDPDWTAIRDSILVQAILAVVLLVSAGSFSLDVGNDEAAKALWGGRAHHEVRLYSSATEPMDDRVYFLVALHEGRYYLRDMASLNATGQQILVVSIDQIHHAEITRVTS